MAITLRMVILMSSIRSHEVFRKWIIMKFFALLCNLARWCWWWQLRFTKRTSNHLWWSWIASIWAEFGWATVCGRSHMHLRRLPTAFCLSPRLIIVADVQLLANPPCSRGNNDDKGWPPMVLKIWIKDCFYWKFSPNAHYLYIFSCGEHTWD